MGFDATPIAHVSQAGSGASAAINTTGANLLVAVAASVSSTEGILDSKSNFWTQLAVEVLGSFSMTASLFYVVNPIVGVSHTFTPAGSTPALCVQAWKTAATPFPHDQLSGASTVSSPAQAGSITPIQNGSLVIAALCGSVSSVLSINSGLTITDQFQINGGVNFSCAMAYLVQSVAAAINPSWTYASSLGTEGALIASFLPSGGGVTVSMSRLPLLGVG